MSQESQHAIIDLLFTLDSSNHDINLSDVSSKHERKRLEKKFMKRLVCRHEQRQLQQRFNAASSFGSNEGATTLSRVHRPVETHQPTASQTSSTIKTNPNVRIELAEAIFSKTSDDKKKQKIGDDKKKSKKVKDANDFKIGTKKVVVVPRTTTISDLLKQSQSKLKLKKKPVRVFIQTSTSNIFELDRNLGSIDDGTVLYVSITPALSERDGTSEAEGGENDNADDETEDAVDPLEQVKRAYLQQEVHKQQKQYEWIDEIVDEAQRCRHEQTRAKLPVAPHRQFILDTIAENGVVILSGNTGSGKSTQVPQFILDQNEHSRQRPYIVVTQPRKVAAILLAHRVAAERGCPSPGAKGSSVGYMVRSDRRVDLRSCRIVYMTIGILLRMLVQPSQTPTQQPPVGNDNTVPLLCIDTISHLIIDEVHERDINTDFSLTLLKGLMSSKSTQQSLPRLVLMSATASSEVFVNYFTMARSIQPVVIEIPGKTYPVQTNWLADCEKFAAKSMMTRGTEYKADGIAVSNNTSESRSVDLAPRALGKIDDKFIRSLIVKIVDQQQTDGMIQLSSNGKRRETGAILVFLPGLSEIESLARCLYDKATIAGDASLCKIMKLHSSIPKSEQERVFQPALNGTVKIVLATNIAETSVTIPDISHVIDTCLVKENRYNPNSRINELVTVWTSRASLKQREGRAGRTSEGVCWRLCSEDFARRHLLAQTAPEIVRTPLDELILQICLLYERRRDDANKSNVEGDDNTQFGIGVKPINFLSATPTPPPDHSLTQACNHLLEVEALKVVDGGSSNEQINWMYRLTPLGYHLSRLPMDAKVGKLLIVGCILGCFDGALTIAAALSCTKSCFLPSTSGRPLDPSCVEARDRLIENGFGGKDWLGGTVKGDLIAVIAVYRAWREQRNDKRDKFCRGHALDNFTLRDMDTLRRQFHDVVVDAGLVPSPVSTLTEGVASLDMDDCNLASEDALLTSCCIVAGLYPNVCSLVRPRKGGAKGGRLLTSNGDSCRPSSNSFQQKRVQQASENGKDVYAVYHTKHRTIGATTDLQRRPPETFLSEVNFISKFALLLFGGTLDLVKNAIIVDGWLKFKVSGGGEKSRGGDVDNAVLILSLRELLDHMILEHVVETFSCPEEKAKMIDRHRRIIGVVRMLLADEG